MTRFPDSLIKRVSASANSIRVMSEPLPKTNSNKFAPSRRLAHQIQLDGNPAVRAIRSFSETTIITVRKQTLHCIARCFHEAASACLLLDDGGSYFAPSFGKFVAGFRYSRCALAPVYWRELFRADAPGNVPMPGLPTPTAALISADQISAD